ncbi:tripartite tricarboxylate transporter substrate binding protein [Rhodovarius crocodyli]|uniref:Tripartite tricarboxylate transporter substrate binding protein n=1 Tax=Rhodovarius crocodyli TaxID=1979269 RepID=A0A437LZ40_9PROT|nr:tripartite tricarboxylate transporter substrate-binding protein [Rhodovarius crocodyli]RVT90606.1 tripartite tricarboxylate transporter substrate binding protein [Rhodovarius crocodyli]
MPQIARRALLATPFLLPAAARAQAWPNQPIKLVVPYAAGGATDVIARLVAEGMSQNLPQRVVVENRTGAGGNIGAGAVARATDGHTLLFSNTGHAVNRALYARLDYDPATDLLPITIVAESPMVLLVPNSAPYRDVAGLVAAAKADPEKLSYATTGTGGVLQLVTLLLLRAAGIQMQDVPYRGSGPAAQDVISGRLDVLYDAGFSAFPLAQGGQARALAVSSAQRSAVMPDVPTIGEAGYPAATFSVWQCLFAPKGTPEAVLGRVQQAVQAAIREPALARRLTELGAERLIANPVPEAARYVSAEMTRWETVLREAGIRPQ